MNLYTSHQLLFVQITSLTQFYQNFGIISNDSNICFVKYLFALPYEPLDIFHQNLHRYLSGTAKTNYKILVTSTLLTRSPGTYIIKKACLYSIILTNDQILTKLTQIIHWEDLNERLEFGSIDLNSKITSVT